ncbi:hypothetical protein [Galbibacter orientalis]|uniref:hypothetical protein n=1 Tax=Galbibacter orientalis TaxID=453852 RepID=UPI003080CF8A
MMDNYIFKALITLIMLYTIGRIAFKYFKILTLFMFNEAIHWDKYVEKPRLFLHCFGIFMMFLALKTSKLWEDPGILNSITQILFLLVFILGALTCHFTWTKKFESTFIQKVKQTLNPVSKLSTSITNQTMIQGIWKTFVSKGYFSCNLETFEALLKLKNPDKRIQWNYTIMKNPNELNRQPLFEILSCIFTEFESLSNSEIIRFCNKYFCDPNNNTISITSKNVTDWKNNTSDYLKEISDIFKGNY